MEETPEQKAAREAEELKTREAEELAAQKQAEEGLKTPEELAAEAEAEADKLLADGTRKDKSIVVKKDKFDEKNDKAKVYDALAPVIDKLIDRPDIVEKLMGKQDGSVEDRVAELERERKDQKQAEMRSALSKAIRAFPDLKDHWNDMEPIVDSLVKKGIPYAEAITRSYIATNPDAARAEEGKVAIEALNREGSFLGGGAPPRVQKQKPSVTLSEDQKKVAKALGYTEEKWAELLEKHKPWIERNATRFN
jgi:hypothetical protein